MQDGTFFQHVERSLKNFLEEVGYFVEHVNSLLEQFFVKKLNFHSNKKC